MHSSDPEAVYIISVAARIVGMHVNTLRKYERQGLIAPSRSDGNLRLFSPHDVLRLRQIKRLVDEHGVNLAGVEVALAVTDQILALRRAVRDGHVGTGEDICQAIDRMLDTLSAAPAEKAPAGHPQEDADEQRKATTRRRNSVRSDSAARRGHARVVRIRRSGPAQTGAGGRPSEVPDLP